MQIEISLQFYSFFPLVDRINQVNNAKHMTFQLLRTVIGHKIEQYSSTVLPIQYPIRDEVQQH